MRTFPILSAVGLGLAFAAGTATAQAECDFSEEMNATLAASPTLRLDTGAGSLQIIGRSDLSEVRVRGTACASSASLLQEIRLRTARDAAGSEVETLMPDRVGRNAYARLDLIVELPASSMVDLIDGSGSVEISGVRGGLVVDDGSGMLTIRDVAGEVRVADGSGEISIERVQGSVIVEEDGSGQIQIADVAGNVTIQEDGSGGIDVEEVAGDLTIGRAGSGGIDYSGVEGAVRVTRR